MYSVVRDCDRVLSLSNIPLFIVFLSDTPPTVDVVGQVIMLIQSEKVGTE